MKRRLPQEPPVSLVAFELEPGRFLVAYSAESGDPSAAIPDLTAAEKMVLHLLLEGKSTARIAKIRRTSTRTVTNQVGSLFRKLGVRSRTELASKFGA